MKNQVNRLRYPTLVWVTNILLSPILLILITTFFFKGNFFGDIKLLFPFYILGFLFSLPAYIIFIFLNQIINNFDINNFTKKLIFSLFGVGLIFLTFYVLGGKTTNILTLSYSSVLLMTCLILKW
jgi:hypothetical protein